MMKFLSGILFITFALLPRFSQADGASLPPLYTATVNGQALVLHEFERGSFGIFEVGKPVDVEIHTNFDLRWVDIRPRSAGITPIVSPDHHSVRFRTTTATPLSVEFNADLKYVLHLFPYAPEKKVPSRSDAKVRYFGPGVHQAGLIELKDGETLYLAPGAWVKGNVRSVSTKNVAIRGRGVLDVSNVHGDPGMDGSNSAIYLNKTAGARIEGITIFNSTAWTVYLRSAIGTQIDGIRILNPASAVGNDGIDVVSSNNVLIQNIFVRTNDDCVVVKNLDDIDTHDILVRHSVLWNMPNGGNGLEIGFETRNHPIHDIRFEDIDLIHVERGSAISIHNGDRAVVENVIFNNIRVEDVHRKLIDFVVLFAQYGADRPKSNEEVMRRMERGGSWDGMLSYAPEEKAERAEFRGHIRNIRVTNLQVIEGGLPYSALAGFDEQHSVENVVIEGMTYQGKPIKTLSEGRFTLENTRNIVMR